jgi:hypothetical protein
MSVLGVLVKGIMTIAFAIGWVLFWPLAFLSRLAGGGKVSNAIDAVFGAIVTGLLTLASYALYAAMYAVALPAMVWRGLFGR